MPASHKVSVAWQIVFTFVPILNLWAFYRIKKLQKYLLYVIAPSIALSVLVLSSIYWQPRFTPWVDDGAAFGSPYDFVVINPNVSIISNAVSVGLQAFAIYLVIIWSRQHNEKFDKSLL